MGIEPDEPGRAVRHAPDEAGDPDPEAGEYAGLKCSAHRSLAAGDLGGEVVIEEPAGAASKLLAGLDLGVSEPRPAEGIGARVNRQGLGVFGELDPEPGDRVEQIIADAIAREREAGRWQAP